MTKWFGESNNLYMGEKEVQLILVDILYSVLNSSKDTVSVCKNITPDILSAVYRLAKKHDLAHIVSNYVYHNSIEVSPEIRDKLQNEEIISVYRYEQMKYAYDEICGVFDEQGVAYIPLKGAVIRPYYPVESMRTSCDIDILIHESDLEVAIKCLKAKGYSCGEKAYHDISLYSSNNIHLELHFNIQENMGFLDEVLKDAWDYAVLEQGSRYAFKKEFFVFHVYAHMAYHFLSGGCGIRFLMDLWIMEHKMEAPFTCAETLLKKAGIYKFATKISKVANNCFSSNVRDEFSDLLLNYLFNGGIYGSKENSIAFQKSSKNSTFIYAVKRLFLPYKLMVIAYPVLKKAPYLLPFCWVNRWCKAIFGGKTKSIIKEINCANKITNQKTEEIKTLQKWLGL